MPDSVEHNVAVIGAGPAGLSCAYFLARLGYRPTILEAEQESGGLLVQGIPSYRLPRQVLAREIDMIRRMGVDIRGGCRLGRDFTLEKLRQEGDALLPPKAVGGGQLIPTPLAVVEPVD